MNDSDDPKDPNIESLEKHIQLDWSEKKSESEATPEASAETIAPAHRGPIRQFYQDLIHVLTEPTYFFKNRYPKIRLSYAFAFGIIVQWLASMLNWLTRAINHETLLDGFLKMRDKLQELPFWKNLPDNFWAQNVDSNSTSMFPAWIVEMLGIALSPFQSLIHFALSGMIYFLGAYFLISKKPKSAHQDPVRISEFVKLACICSAPALVASILGFLPMGLGSMIGWFYGIAILIVGMTIRFQISGLRAIAILIVPGLVTTFALLFTFGIFLALLLGMLAALFH